MSWLYFLFGMSCICSIFLLVVSLLKYKSEKDESSSDEQAVEDFIKAKEVFVRDPLDFKDKDRDGVDDIVDKNV